MFRRLARDMLAIHSIPEHWLVRNSLHCRRARTLGTLLTFGVTGNKRHPEIHMAGPIGTREELHTLAHEIGHLFLHVPWTSQKLYLKEYEAEMFALEVMRGFSLYGPDLLESARRNVHMHCVLRDRTIVDPEWDDHVIGWCRFRPRPRLD